MRQGAWLAGAPRGRAPQRRGARCRDPPAGQRGPRPPPPAQRRAHRARRARPARRRHPPARACHPSRPAGRATANEATQRGRVSAQLARMNTARKACCGTHARGAVRTRLQLQALVFSQERCVGRGARRSGGIRASRLLEVTILHIQPEEQRVVVQHGREERVVAPLRATDMRAQETSAAVCAWRDGVARCAPRPSRWRRAAPPRTAAAARTAARQRHAGMQGSASVRAPASRARRPAQLRPRRARWPPARVRRRRQAAAAASAQERRALACLRTKLIRRMQP